MDVLRLDAPRLSTPGYKALLQRKLEAILLYPYLRGHISADNHCLVDLGDQSEVWLGMDR